MDGISLFRLEKEWRNRDDEFIDTLKTKETILNAWDSGWCCLFDAMHVLKDEYLSKEVFIRNMVQTVQAALHRQLAHSAYHVGQIVFTEKRLPTKTGSLSQYPLENQKNTIKGNLQNQSELLILPTTKALSVFLQKYGVLVQAHNSVH